MITQRAQVNDQLQVLSLLDSSGEGVATVKSIQPVSSNTSGSVTDISTKTTSGLIASDILNRTLGQKGLATHLQPKASCINDSLINEKLALLLNSESKVGDLPPSSPASSGEWTLVTRKKKTKSNIGTKTFRQESVPQAAEVYDPIQAKPYRKAFKTQKTSYRSAGYQSDMSKSEKLAAGYRVNTKAQRRADKFLARSSPSVEPYSEEAFLADVKANQLAIEAFKQPYSWPTVRIARGEVVHREASEGSYIVKLILFALDRKTKQHMEFRISLSDTLSNLRSKLSLVGGTFKFKSTQLQDSQVIWDLDITYPLVYFPPRVKLGGYDLPELVHSYITSQQVYLKYKLDEIVDLLEEAKDKTKIPAILTDKPLSKLQFPRSLSEVKDSFSNNLPYVLGISLLSYISYRLLINSFDAFSSLPPIADVITPGPYSDIPTYADALIKSKNFPKGRLLSSDPNFLPDRLSEILPKGHISFTSASLRIRAILGFNTTFVTSNVREFGQRQSDENLTFDRRNGKIFLAGRYIMDDNNLRPPRPLSVAKFWWFSRRVYAERQLMPSGPLEAINVSVLKFGPLEFNPFAQDTLLLENEPVVSVDDQLEMIQRSPHESYLLGEIPGQFIFRFKGTYNCVTIKASDWAELRSRFNNTGSSARFSMVAH